MVKDLHKFNMGLSCLFFFSVRFIQLYAPQTLSVIFSMRALFIFNCNSGVFHCFLVSIEVFFFLIPGLCLYSIVDLRFHKFMCMENIVHFFCVFIVGKRSVENGFSGSRRTEELVQIVYKQKHSSDKNNTLPMKN